MAKKNVAAAPLSPDELVNSIVGDGFKGKCDRFDSKIQVDGTLREVSMYVMSDDLVRCDFKKAVQQ